MPDAPEQPAPAAASTATAAPPASAPPVSTAAAPPPRRRKRRWFLRILLVLIILLLLIAAAVQAVLWTDIPRNLVIAEVQNALGLRLGAESMRTTWRGHTVLRDVTLSLPLGTEPMARVPVLEVDHTILPLILLRRGGLDIHALTLERPTLHVRQNEAGRWNVEEALEVALRAAGARAAEPVGGQRLQLPELTIRSATVQVIDNQGRGTKISPLEVRGEPMGALAWQFSARAEPQLAVEGEVAPGGSWNHVVRFHLEQLATWGQPWVTQFPEITRAHGAWDGRLTNGVLRGRLRMDEVAVDQFTGSGVVRVVQDQAGYTFRPDGIEIVTNREDLPSVLIRSGDVMVGAAEIRAVVLRLAAAGGDAEINGRYSWREQAARLNAVWNNIHILPNISNSGTLNASLSEPWPGQPQIEARLITSGTTDIGSWDGQLVLQSTESRSWDDIDWQLTVPAATWTRRNTYGVNDLVARLTTRGQLVTLQSVSLPSEQRLRGTGQYNHANGQWSVNLAGRSVELPRIADTVIDLSLIADGDAHRYVRVRKLEISAGELIFAADGFYDIREPQPVALNFTAQHTPPPIADQDPFIRGQLLSEGSIKGTLQPFDLDIAGELFGKGLIIRERPMGDPRVELTGKVLADAARVETTELQLLGGVWQFLGTWDGVDDAVHVELAVRNLPASEIGDVLEVEHIRGTVSGNWHARVPALRLNRITAEGDLRIDAPVAGEFVADHLTAHTTLQKGVVRLDPVEARSGRGSANATVQFRTNDPLRWRAQLTASDWPLDYLTDDGQISAAVQTGPIELDLRTRSAWGEVALGAQLGLYGSDLGDIEARTRLEGRTLTLRRAQGELLGGRLDAMGVFSLDEPLNTRGQIALESVNIIEATRLWPSLEGLEGMYSLSATLGPSTGPRPLGPLELRASLLARNGRYNTIELGDASLIAYYAPAAEGQRERVIINQSHLAAAGGEIRLWGRSTRQPDPAGQSYFASQLQVEFENLQLHPIIHAVHETEDQYPALVHGSITLTGDAQDYRNLYGQGRVELTESDLIGVDFIGFLYRRVVGAEPQEPIGHGQVDVRFEAGALNVTSFRYFNRGFEVRATAVADDLWALGKSPVNGTAFGTAQPLRGLRLPFFSDVDRILEVIQRDAVSVRISGRLEDYNVEVVPFGEVGDTVRRMLLGDIRDDVRGGAAP